MKMSELFEKVETLQNLLVSRAAGGEAHNTQYKSLRSELINDSFVSGGLPRFVRTCLDLDQFWNFIKKKSGTYQKRREYIWHEFRPSLEMTEDTDTGSKSIFLSHNSKDKFFVRNLSDHLRSYGVRVWLAEAEISVGDSLTQKIGEAIEETDYVGVVLSHNSINSEWVQRELQIALQKEIRGKKIVVLPILIETVEIPPFLKDKLYADFTTPERFEIELQKLLRALGVSVEREKKKIDATPANIPKKPSAQLTVLERRLTSFEDIEILEIDDSKSYKPNPMKSLYNIYMKLSASPPTEWREIFEAERRFPRHTMWRNAWIEEGHIVIHCVPDELEEYHAKDLMEDMDKSNSKYRKYLMEEAQKEARKVGQERSERNKLKELKQRLRFS